MSHPSTRPELAHDYMVYGLRIRSHEPFAIPDAPGEGSPALELVPEPDLLERSISQLQFNSSESVHLHELPGGWSYIRYDGMFDFLVTPSGNRTYYRLLGPAWAESFQTYALGRVLSLALVKMGIEPFHAATVVVDGRAVAFLGSSGYGKSSLAACFVAGQHALLTDDILRFQEEGGCVTAFPGPPQIKLVPSVAALFLGRGVTGFRLDSRSAKFVFPVSPLQSRAIPVPLAAIYTLDWPEAGTNDQIHIQSQTPTKALLNLLGFSLNGHLSDKDRLRRQFLAIQHLLDRVPIRKLVYPRILSMLPRVRAAVLADLDRSGKW